MTKMQKPTNPCRVCGSNDWWYQPPSELGGPGGWLCSRCQPNPNPGSDPEPPITKEKYSPELLALRDRVILGNKKLNDAWGQICQMDHESQEWKEEMERWHQANERLSVLCSNLQGMGYQDCLYLDSQGKKAVKCLEQNGIGCRVCPSSIHYWKQELQELPGPEREVKDDNA